MFFGTIIQQAVLLIISSIYLKQVLSNEILKLEVFSYCLISNHPLDCELKGIIHFSLSLKKVRIGLESKTPLDLKQKLKNFTLLRWFYICIVGLFFVAYIL
jgi:hypothetical protein